MQETRGHVGKRDRQKSQAGQMGSARARGPEGAGRAAKSGTGPGGGNWTRVPAEEASIPELDAGRGGDEESGGEETVAVSPLKLGRVALQGLQISPSAVA